jgi:hypothetical protein
VKIAGWKREMILGQVFERFVKESPVSVMVRGLLGKALCPQILDELFERSAKTQYTRELLDLSENSQKLAIAGFGRRVSSCYPKPAST